MEYNEFGEELPDPTPVSIPFGAGRPESLQESIKRMIRNELSQYAEKQQMETFEEAQDFDCDEDELVSPYEMSELQEEVPASEMVNLYKEGSDGQSRESDRNHEGGEGVSESSDGVDTAPGGDDNGSPRRAHRRASEKDVRGRNPRRKAVSSQADVRSGRLPQSSVEADDEE